MCKFPTLPAKSLAAAAVPQCSPPFALLLSSLLFLPPLFSSPSPPPQPPPPPRGSSSNATSPLLYASIPSPFNFISIFFSKGKHFIAVAPPRYSHGERSSRAGCLEEPPCVPKPVEKGFPRVQTGCDSFRSSVCSRAGVQNVFEKRYPPPPWGPCTPRAPLTCKVTSNTQHLEDRKNLFELEYAAFHNVLIE